MTQTSDHIKQALDVASVITAVGTFMEYLPSVAALLSIVWTGLRIWETETVRKWTGREVE
jgi:hypothetical protein